MTFNFDSFQNDLVGKFTGILDHETISELLGPVEEYGKDRPHSTGKRLILTRIAFTGVKVTNEPSAYSNDSIDYKQTIGNGVNMWIGDNLKGKSSIFKVIKYALTGKNSLKPNINSWIREIFLNFNIGHQPYTVWLNKENPRLRAILAKGTFVTAGQITYADDNHLIVAKSETAYMAAIQEFFFSEFSYYPLKWTQKSSQKGKLELYEASTSWVTYFQSILLESKDSNVMFGDQVKKIFEMLLGLELTYPINLLKVKSDFLKHETALSDQVSEKVASTMSEQEQALRERAQEIDKDLARLGAESKNEANMEMLIEKYDKLLNEIKKRNDARLTAEVEIQKARLAIEKIKGKKHLIDEARTHLQAENNKTTRSINDIKEYLDIGILFANLTIKQCPSCNHTIPESRLKAFPTTHECYVCRDNLQEDEPQNDPSSFQAKIDDLETLLYNLTEEENKLSGIDNHLSEALESEANKLQEWQIWRSATEKADSLTADIAKLENEINHKRANMADTGAKTNLIAEQAIIRYRLEQMASSEIATPVLNDAISQISFLDAAVAELTNLRYSIGQQVIHRLQDLILSQLHDLGLTSISAIQISPALEITYKQDVGWVGFDDIAEGEQLRAKIAFYLSLIQLDIEFNFGRHTRLLIIDSPGKEEADDKYLHGFSTILNHIQEKFSDSLQILIGTAQRELTGAVTQEYITPENTFVF